MPRTNRSELRDRVKNLLRAHDRFVDLGVRVQVVRRIDGEVIPGEIRPTIYGGRYDRLMRRYVGAPENIQTITATPGQLGLLEFDEPGMLRLLALGAPGAGKTYGAVRKALIKALQRCNSTGGLVGPTNDRRMILWTDFLNLVEPLGFVEEVQKTDKRIVLKNNTVIEVLAAKKPSAAQGNPLQGRSWDWAVADESQNIEDEAQTEIDTRGRRAGTSYVVFETATNQTQVPGFKVRIERYKNQPKTHKIMSFSGDTNSFVDPSYWERLKSTMTEREYKRLILCEDLPPELLQYPAFSYSHSIRQAPEMYSDMTPKLTKEMFGRPFRWVIGQDFGVLCNASIVFKAFREPDTGECLWFAVDEITTHRSPASIHARKILERYHAGEVVVVADPHHNSKDTDKSDYAQFRHEGLTIFPAVSKGKIDIKHRVNMMNALLEDAKGKRRLYLACDANGKEFCPNLARALSTIEIDELGRLDQMKKDRNDLTHWPCAAGYGLWKWEKIRAPAQVQMRSTLAGQVGDNEAGTGTQWALKAS